MRIALKPIARQAMLVAGASSGIGLVTAARAARLETQARGKTT